MIKLSLNAVAKHELAKKFGLIFEGTGRNWALRNLRKGKTFEDLGSISKKHLSAAMPKIKRYSSKGREVGFRTYKTKRTPIQIGGVGFTPGFKESKKITKSFHTHPYKGIMKQGPEGIMRSLLAYMSKAKGTPFSKDKVDEIIRGMKSSGQLKEIKKQLSVGKTLSKTQMAHPDPTKLHQKGQMTDITSMARRPNVHENILNPYDKILGIHKLRRGGVREVYRQV